VTLSSRRPRVLLLLLLITMAGGVLRFYGLGHGAPYHFHADEMLALRGATLLRADPQLAANSAKFFIYPVLPKELLALAIGAYEALEHPLDLAAERDAKVLMLLGRAISATAATLTIPIVFLVGRRLVNPARADNADEAGLLAAGLFAVSVVAVANAHFFTADSILTLFCALSLLAIVRVAQDGTWRSYALAGASLGLALASKYTAAFLLLPLAVAHLLSTSRTAATAGVGGWLRWLRWAGLGVAPLIVAGLIFLAVNPLIFEHWGRFLADVREGIVEPNFGDTGPIWTAQFADVALRRYWFTNLLPWNLGPAFAVWALAGVAWLVWRRDRASLAAASFAIFYYVIASRTTTPYMRYLLPVVPALAAAAGVLSADLLRRTDVWRRFGQSLTTLVVVTTGLWALAYMNVYRRLDVRVQAAQFINLGLPEGARVLVEPSHNTPPMGSYFLDPLFFNDYVGWGATTVRTDRFVLHTLDVYVHLYDAKRSVEEKRQYIRDRLALVDYIVMDDTFEEFYEHLHGPAHAPVREYYRELFAGRLGFDEIRRFKVHPALAGLEIPDESAEMTFSLFDHPTVHVFRRRQPADTTPAPQPPR
jgi:4-amino-4-deoxy-L-arabinose transferase-like glycosyltransferase